tara:strand:+ start:856 stop:2193 length:1338 start_codon:yes stop_codon:yes gene_type:complete
MTKDPSNEKRDKTIILFNYDWDLREFDKLKKVWPQITAGFDLFSFPSNVRLIWFDIVRFCSIIIFKAKFNKAKAIVSNHEQFGALCAAMIAEKMNWPGTPVKAILACQNKLYARQILKAVAPQANVEFQKLSARYQEKINEKIEFPLFAKPVKAAFSVLAKRIDTYDTLEKHINFSKSELWIIKHLVNPFEKIFQRYFPNSESTHSLILEELIEGDHLCLNGYFYKNEMESIGVVDSIMYPNTNAFMRFEYPSCLPQERMWEAEGIAKLFLNKIGFSHGMFNMEFIIEKRTKALKVIEFNPRMASQFADLFERVDGIKMHSMALALAHGLNPKKISKVKPSSCCAASFVFRMFKENNLNELFLRKNLKSCLEKFPDILLFNFPKTNKQVKRDLKWIGSYRYGVIHLGGKDHSDLKCKCKNASHILGWTAPYVSEFRNDQQLSQEK